jgi:hypothetical protein
LVLTAVVVAGIAYRQHAFEGGSPSASGPAKDVALPGGGVSDGGECGRKGFHHFAVSAATHTDDAEHDPPQTPQLVFGSYGGGIDRIGGARTINVSLLFGLGTAPSMDLAAPLGPEGVAIEIEGPKGLVAGAHGLPVTLDDPAVGGADGKIHIGRDGGGSASVKIPAQALCPGYDVNDVIRKLMLPIDSRNTITGPPPYILTVSISDPAIGVVRKSYGVTTAGGDVLSTDNRAETAG